MVHIQSVPSQENIASRVSLSHESHTSPTSPTSPSHESPRVRRQFACRDVGAGGRETPPRPGAGRRKRNGRGLERRRPRDSGFHRQRERARGPGTRVHGVCRTLRTRQRHRECPREANGDGPTDTVDAPTGDSHSPSYQRIRVSTKKRRTVCESNIDWARFHLDTSRYRKPSRGLLDHD